MPLHKIIYRFDFKPNFEIIDSAGKLLGILQEQGCWPQLGESINERSITGKDVSEDKGYFCTVGIKPTSIIGQFELIEGIELNGIEKLKIFNNMVKTTNILRKEFNICDFIRAGFRLFVFNPLDHDLEKVHLGYNKIFTSFADDLSETLGEFKDSGIKIDGEHKNGIYYKFKFGPYLNDFNKIINEIKVTPNIQQRIDEIENTFKLTYDLDFFEKNKHLSETTNLKKWALPLMDRASKAISTIESIVTQNIEVD